MLRLACLLCLTAIFTAATCNRVPKEDIACIDESKIDPDAVCIEIYEPVCGCDGKTYPNDCYARIAGLTSWTKGECPCIDPEKIAPDRACAKVFMPVCGCDGKTYSNACEAEKAGLTSWKDGKCKQ